MLIWNGTDYTLYVVGILGAVFFFALQCLCLQAKRRVVKYIPLYGIAALLLLPLLVLSADNRGSMLDLRGAVAAVMAVFALLCAGGAGCAWGLWYLKGRRK